MPEFTLVNPIIKGNFQTKYSDDNVENAANKMWSNLSEHIIGNVPRFAFTLANMEDGTLHSFLVKEKLKNKHGKGLNCTIKKIETNLNKNQQSSFLSQFESLSNKINNIGQSGGEDDDKEDKKDKKKSKRYDDDSDSDSDKDVLELYGNFGYFRTKYMNQPISYWWYTPLLYQLDGYTSVYIPTFQTPIVPYIEIALSSAFF